MRAVPELKAGLYVHAECGKAVWRSQHVHGPEPVWDAGVEWVVPANESELAFVRLVVKRADWAEHQELACYALRLEYVDSGLRVAKLLDSKGVDRGASMLVRITVNKID